MRTATNHDGQTATGCGTLGTTRFLALSEARTSNRGQDSEEDNGRSIHQSGAMVQVKFLCQKTICHIA